MAAVFFFIFMEEYSVTIIGHNPTSCFFLWPHGGAGTPCAGATLFDVAVWGSIPGPIIPVEQGH